MFEIPVGEAEIFNEETFEIFRTKPTVLKLEHSLLSISKWESKWKIPFLKEKEKTTEQFLDYIRCMTITQNIDPRIYKGLSYSELKAIKEYIDDPMTATWFNDQQNTKKNGRTVTSELIYCWMTQNNIPFECEKWNFNRLMTLIRVCNAENAPKKKMGKDAVFRQNSALNEKRKKAMHTRG